MNSDNEKSTSFGKRLIRALANMIKFVLRLFLLLVGGGLLGIVIYLGYVYLYQLALNELSANSVEIGKMQTQQDIFNDGVDQRFELINERLTFLESQRSIEAEKVDELEVDLEKINGSSNGYDEVDKRLEDLENDLVELTDAFDALRQGQDLVENEDQVYFDQQLYDQVTQYSQEIKVLQAMQMVSRASYLMLDGDQVGAEMCVQEAYDVLQLLHDEVPEDQKSVVGLWIGWVGYVLDNLDSEPVKAVEGLDVVWNLLMSGLSNSETQEVTTAPKVEDPLENKTMTPTPVPTIFFPTVPLELSEPGLIETPTPFEQFEEATKTSYPEKTSTPTMSSF